jgi:hypothetical protein
MGETRTVSFPFDASTVSEAALSAGEDCGFEVVKSDPAAGTVQFVSGFSWLAFGNERVDIRITPDGPDKSTAVIVVRRIYYGTWLTQWFRAGRLEQYYADALAARLRDPGSYS